ncbi:MAG: hypothetical protein EBT79_11645 [Actinobacteria bacterium]|nr:hypothetical protein [Actinomycetota bacterium]
MQLVAVPFFVPVTVPVFDDPRISHESLPLFGPNSPTNPPTLLCPVTEPENDELTRDGMPEVQDVFWSPRFPTRPPTFLLPVTVAEEFTPVTKALTSSPAIEPAYAELGLVLSTPPFTDPPETVMSRMVAVEVPPEPTRTAVGVLEDLPELSIAGETNVSDRMVGVPAR